MVIKGSAKRGFVVLAGLSGTSADASVAIAASRARSLGLLDLAFCPAERLALDALQKLQTFAAGPCGVKLDGSLPKLFEAVVRALPPIVGTVILVPSARAGESQIAALKQRGVQVIVEATDGDEAAAAEDLGADGVIAKGNEAGGRVGEETTFILLQRLLAECRLPVFAQGGIGLHTAAACYAAGAAGVVLDTQFALTRESPLAPDIKDAIRRMDGSETECVGKDLRAPHRVLAGPTCPGGRRLRDLALQIRQDGLTQDGMGQDEPGAAWQGARDEWREQVRVMVGWAPGQAWPVGQEAAFAKHLHSRHNTVAGIVQAFRGSIDEHVRLARRLRPLDEGSPLALSHGTRFPIVQGPMTRVSDCASFAEKVGAAGALPFLALALMHQEAAQSLLEETRAAMGERPWGVGILGFVPPDLREQQMGVICRNQPTFALIAGGRPDQALSLEKAGIPTYLHVPSPGLLDLFLEGGARRFVFEGRECGGHVGPRSSFVLWDTMIGVLLQALAPSELANCHVLFAGGIHDARSASMVAAAAAPLADGGGKVGVLLGTAYLFAQETVMSGAIVGEFQHQAVACERTALLETGPGQATRCADSPFAATFDDMRRRLRGDGSSQEQIHSALEELNLGRLRMAAKGRMRKPAPAGDVSSPEELMSISEAEQRAGGLYMMGQVAALRRSAVGIEDLHHDVSVRSSEWLDALEDPLLLSPPARRLERPSAVAIVGMACLFPGANDVETYWRNMLARVDAVTEIPASRWEWQRYYDPDPGAPDKVYSRWGGFLQDVAFDPGRYGIPPASLPSIEPLQLLSLEVARAALEDAGYAERSFDRRTTSVILGVGGGVADLGQQYALRAGLPMLFDTVPADLEARLPGWTEDSFPGILLNVTAGRIANRLDLGGVNYTVDAACASSLAALQLAIRELEAGTSDMVLVGGADTVQNPFGYLCFSKTHALSPRGRCRPFDEGADGIAISEGVGVVVLKRLEDAEVDGDRIYAVIKGVGGSSDGRALGLTAPRSGGQALALERAYAKAGISPATVTLVEAHGTGTSTGDRAELETLRTVFDAAGAPRKACALGSVKSMIGHTKSAAGVAALIKVAKALHHRVLPPTIHVERPSPELQTPESPFYVATEARPWLRRPGTPPRRAGISAFGFGGTNFHAVLEEYPAPYPNAEGGWNSSWPSELLTLAGTVDELQSVIGSLEKALAGEHDIRLADLAYSSWLSSRNRSGTRITIVASSLDRLRERLTQARRMLTEPHRNEPAFDRSVCLSHEPWLTGGSVAFLFPGQGSQYPHMLRDLAMHFPEVREAFERADGALGDAMPEGLSRYVFPPPAIGGDEEVAAVEALTNTRVAQPALAAACCAVTRLLDSFGLEPDLVAGHSFGEYVALWAGGVFSEETLYLLAEARGRSITASKNGDLGAMAAVAAPRGRVEEVLASVDGVWVANENAPTQTVISGTQEGLRHALERLDGLHVDARRLQVSCGFHSPLVEGARERLARELSAIDFAEPRIPVFSNTTALPYPSEPESMQKLLQYHLVRPVKFAEEVEELHRAGARFFIEAGPGQVLRRLTSQILSGKPHCAVATDARGRSGLEPLQNALARLWVSGAPVTLDRLYEGRLLRQLDLDRLGNAVTPLSPGTWFVNGGRARPAHTGLDEAARSAPAAVAPPAMPSPTPVENGVAPESALGPPPSPAEPTPVNTVRDETGTSDASIGRDHRSAEPPVSTPVEAVHMRAAEATQVVVGFQRLMQQFLDTQREVMGAYLQTGASPNGQGDQLAASPAPEALTPKPSRSREAELLRPIPPASAPEPEGHPLNPPAPEAALPGAGPEDPKGIEDLLVQIVSDRTGYPPESLPLDVDIEAELGIDSIKRVEIIGTLRRTLGLRDAEAVQAAMEKLTRIKTLAALAAAIRLATASSQEQPGPGSSSPAGPPEPAGPAGAARPGQPPPGRFRVCAVESPLPLSARGELRLPGVVLITDDGRGVAGALAGYLREAGVRSLRVRPGTEGTDGEGNLWGDLGSPEGATRIVAEARRTHGAIAGLCHLLPLRDRQPVAQLDPRMWRPQIDLDVRSLFWLLRELEQDLLAAARDGGASVLAATALGGAFGTSGLPAGGFPGQGAIVGLIKSLALEWPAVRMKVVDVAPADPTPLMAQSLAQEMAASDGETEVGYPGRSRVLIRPIPAPLSRFAAAATATPIDSSWVFLVTGGARGITGLVARELAERFKPTLVLVGRSPLPSEEDPATAGLSSPRDLREKLIQKLRAEDAAVVPASIEAELSRLLAAREITESLDAMRRAGATVHYVQADVRDEAAFPRLIRELYGSYGKIDAVVHGAGVIEDRRIADKTPDSFDRVFETKVAGALLLCGELDPATLRLMVLFTSTAARFGNLGQSDYAAANEVLNKLACELNRRWPSRVVAINWGPWDRAGMVSPELKRQFEDRGVRLVTAAAGKQSFIDELLLGPKEDAEVIIGDGPWSALSTEDLASTTLPAEPTGTPQVIDWEPERSEASRLREGVLD